MHAHKWPIEFTSFGGRIAYLKIQFTVNIDYDHGLFYVVMLLSW